MKAPAALALLSILAITSPVFADDDFDADRALRQLQDRGVAATSVEEWNGYLRAFVTIDGQQVMRFFDPDTFTPVAL